VNQILAVAAWWLCLEIIGLAAWPLTASFLRDTKTRGAAFAKHLGLLLAGYLLWLLVSLRLLENTRVAILLVIAFVAGFSLLAWRRERLIHLWRVQRGELLRAEALFLLAFLGYLAFRAYDPSISHTEQPMDFGFLNAILRSRTFPPNDMWLSGYAISYYYFGYLLMAMLARLSAVPSGVAYNLALGTVFALTVTGAYGLVRDLTADLRCTRACSVGLGLLGAAFVGVAGNLVGFLELLHARGLGSPAFWRWVDIPALVQAPASGGWLPGPGWWWWRATRLIQDVNPFGKLPEVITEFPVFSFILGDLHPHVMALPFGLLALAVAWNLLRSVAGLPDGRRRGEVTSPLPDGTRRGEVTSPLLAGRRVTWPALPPLAGLVPLVIGSLGFLNSWDLPTYAFVAVAAYALGRATRYRSLSRAWASESLGFGLLLSALSIALYLPFYVGFRSQVGGLGIVDYTKTPWQHYAFFFGLFLTVLVPWLAGEGLAAAQRPRFLGSYALALAVLLALPLMLTLAAGGPGRTLLAGVTAAIRGPWLALCLALLVALGAVLLWSRLRAPAEAAGQAATFALLLACTGLLLTFGTEFVFIRDSFGTRMNTMFKLYYQAWALLAIASAYGVGEIVRRLGGERRVLASVWLGCMALLFLATLYYPVAAATSKAELFTAKPTLDGTAWLDPGSGEGAAIAWLAREVRGSAVILEAPGDSYNAAHNRVSAWTGLPTVLGWVGHEAQWRGGYDEISRRLPDVAAIYQGRSASEVRTLLDRYQVEYVYVGPYEREKYGLSAANLALFDQLLDRVYDRDGVLIFRRR
jgi:YYY domain-containing protein